MALHWKCSKFEHSKIQICFLCHINSWGSDCLHQVWVRLYQIGKRVNLESFVNFVQNLQLGNLRLCVSKYWAGNFPLNIRWHDTWPQHNLTPALSVLMLLLEKWLNEDQISKVVNWVSRFLISCLFGKTANNCYQSWNRWVQQWHQKSIRHKPAGWETKQIHAQTISCTISSRPRCFCFQALVASRRVAGSRHTIWRVLTGRWKTARKGFVSTCVLSSFLVLLLFVSGCTMAHWRGEWLPVCPLRAFIDLLRAPVKLAQNAHFAYMHHVS